jgi:hypothetical protein
MPSSGRNTYSFASGDWDYPFLEDPMEYAFSPEDGSRATFPAVVSFRTQTVKQLQENRNAECNTTSLELLSFITVLICL